MTTKVTTPAQEPATLAQLVAQGVDLISVPATAPIIDVRPETLYSLIRQGEFPPAVRIGRQIRVSVPRLERYLHGGDAA